MSDRLTVILPPILSAEERVAEAIDYNSLTEADGWGDGNGYGNTGGCGFGDGYGDIYSYSFSSGGDGLGHGYVGTDGGDGESTADIE